MLFETTAGTFESACKLFECPDALFRWRSGGRGMSSVITRGPVEGFISRPLSQQPNEFFEVLKRYGDFTWRQVGNAIEMCIVPDRRGWWIGKGGIRIRALQEHLGMRVVLVDGVAVVNRDTGLPSDSVFAGHRDPGLGMMLVEGYIAPWQDLPEGARCKRMRG